MKLAIRNVSCLCVLFASVLSWAVDFKEGFKVEDALVISGQQVDLEVAWKKEDQNKLSQLAFDGLKDGYIFSLYAEDSSEIDEDFLAYQLFRKFERNEEYKDSPSETDFSRLYYAVKLKNDQSVIGTIEIYSSGGGAELGAFIAKEHSGKGYGTDAVGAAIDFLRKKTTVKKVVWECYADNPGSNQIAKKCGFIFQTDFDLSPTRKANSYLLKVNAEK